MSINLSNIKWGWVILGVVIAFVFAYGMSICVVTGYAGYLGFQVRGTPDMDMINAFANRTAEGVISVAIGFGTFFGGLLAGRRVKEEAMQNGLMVGIVTAVISLLMSIFGGFSLFSVVSLMLAFGGGWLGGSLASKRA